MNTIKIQFSKIRKQNQEQAEKALHRFNYIKGKHELAWLDRKYLAKTFRVSLVRVSHAFSGNAPLLCAKISQHLDKLDSRYSNQFMQSSSENVESINTALTVPSLSLNTVTSSSASMLTSKKC